ncbi:protein of unknown function [Nitratireductor aquimarinus]
MININRAIDKSQSVILLARPSNLMAATLLPKHFPQRLISHPVLQKFDLHQTSSKECPETRPVIAIGAARAACEERADT